MGAAARGSHRYVAASKAPTPVVCLRVESSEAVPELHPHITRSERRRSSAGGACQAPSPAEATSVRETVPPRRRRPGRAGPPSRWRPAARGGPHRTRDTGGRSGPGKAHRGMPGPAGDLLVGAGRHPEGHRRVAKVVDTEPIQTSRPCGRSPHPSPERGHPQRSTLRRTEYERPPDRPARPGNPGRGTP